MKKQKSIGSLRLWKSSIIALTQIVCWSGCASDPVDLLPVETQSGQQTIACRIEENIWRPATAIDWSGKGGSDRTARYSSKQNMLFVTGFNEKNSQLIGFSIVNCTKEGTYILSGRNEDVLRPTVNGGYFSPSKYIETDTYWTDSLRRGEVVITKLTKQIVAGRFSFEVVNAQTGKTLRITDGRFDLYYSPGVGD